ncbi:MAG TPA: HPP family protein [Novosphingobium sp.]
MPYRLLVAAASRATGRLGWARGAAGALIGVALAGMVGHLLFGDAPGALPWLVAPLGASAVLVFALPASPLAQPWPVIGGNMISATIGLASAHLLPTPELACAVAVGIAIAMMSLLRCLHPPGGACALLGALGGQTIALHGWPGLLLPLGIDIAALLAAGWLYNNLTKHPYPHRMARVPPLPPEGWVGSYDAADLDAVLEDWDEVLDVSREDLDALFRAVERRVQRRWLRERGER